MKKISDEGLAGCVGNSVLLRTRKGRHFEGELGDVDGNFCIINGEIRMGKGRLPNPKVVFRLRKGSKYELTIAHDDGSLGNYLAQFRGRYRHQRG
jgi:hypothetical protein